MASTKTKRTMRKAAHTSRASITAAQRKARKENIKKAQRARWKKRR